MKSPVKFTINYRLPTINDNLKPVIDLLESEPKKVCCKPRPNCFENDCHNNVDRYVNMYGGEKITGFNLIVNREDNSIVAIRHSVWKNNFDEVIDITKFGDSRNFNIFIETDKHLDKTAIQINDNIKYF